jgi:hypothetical protein
MHNEQELKKKINKLGATLMKSKKLRILQDNYIKKQYLYFKLFLYQLLI